MKRLVLLFAFLFLTGFAGFAQKVKKFTADPEVYPTELRELLSSTKTKSEIVDQTMADFMLVWSSGGIDEREADAIYKISNNFLKKRITSFEPWNEFIKILYHFENQEEEEYLAPWLENLAAFSKKNTSKKTKSYLNTMYLSFYENTFFDDGRVSWKAMGGDYEFSYEGEPVFTYEAMDLWGHYKNDSTIIEATTGKFYPLKYKFVGNEGIVYFTRAGLSQDSASVELRKYEVDVRKTDFTADSASLSTLIFLKDPLLGTFQEKLTSQSGSGGTFPRFLSYAQDIAIPDIVEGVDFEGGFSLIGSKFYGGGGDSTTARLLFKYEGKSLVTASSDRFLLRPDKLNSDNVSILIRLDEDSIYHPKVTLRYLPDFKQLSIIREKKGLGQTPFSDSYHNLDIVFETLNWNLDEPQMKLGNMNLGSESPVYFESENYYRGARFSQLQGLDTENPLYRLQRISQTYTSDEFTVEQLARELRMDIQHADLFLMQLSVLGFVTYDLENKKVTFKQKIFDYINNFEKTRDYDVIRFVSNLTQGSNASLSLLDYAMEIDGVKAIALSDSQKVGLFPRDQKITVYKDLNFDFDGRVAAGRFTYWGEQFKFNYDQFRINMENVDSMRFKVESFEPNPITGARDLVGVKTVLQELTGELLIDQANNKSGRENYDEYPIFKSAKESYIYYDKKSIHGGVYDRSTFYVTLEPFEIDSLDNISTQGLKFDGTFTSANIFPELQQEIKVQKDYSLGFTTETPPEGLAAYGGKGTFTNSLALSNKGLRGNGVIDYLNSTATSDEFLFFPDSTNGLANTYEITSETTAHQTPHVVGTAVGLHWEPYNDVLYTRSRETPFAMYDDIGMTAEGTLAHSPSALKGDALLKFLDAQSSSKDFLFENRKFTSPELAFKVRANPDAKWGFELANARGEVDFDKQKGDFYLNNAADYFKFPANKYICYMDYAKWLIPDKAINLSKTSATAASKMVSIHPQQDSLQFVAGHSKFYLESSLLESFKVPNIDVADASIFPDTGYVVIEKNAKMRTLENAAITANRFTKFHEFLGSTVHVYSRRRYTAKGDYEYLDEDGTPWPIRFEQIQVDTAGTTYGKASVAQEDGFYMSPYFAYYGRVELRANRKALTFDGYTHIETTCPSVNSDWFGFKSVVDPSNIIIDLPDIDLEDRTKNLNNGIYLAPDTAGGYAAFLSRSVTSADKEMFFATGKLYYDTEITSYVIIDNEMFDDPDVKGNYLAFNNVNCTMHGEGIMSLGDRRSQLDFNSMGVIDYNLNNDQMTMDLVLGIEFLMDDGILELMANAINGDGLLEGADLGRDAFKIASRQLLKPKDMEKLMDNIANYGAPEELPDEFQQTILLSDIKMNWTPEATSFLAEGKIGIGGLGKYAVNKKVKGYFEIQRKRRGDEMYMYLEVNSSTFYYFEYKRNKMTLYSSDDELTTKLKELDPKKRRREVDDKPPFTYTIGTKGKMNRFLNRMEDLE